MTEVFKITRHNSLFSLTVFVLLLFGIAACTLQGKDKEDKPAPPPAAGIAVDIEIVKPHSLSENLEVTGTLAANQEVNIASELMRKVVAVHVREGNFVAKGTLLFQLDDADLQAQLEQLLQREKLAQLNEDRLKELILHDAAVQQDYDQASTNLKVLQAEIRQLQVTIDKTRIRAPFDGRIGIIRSYPGALVTPNTLLANFVDDKQIKVEFSVPEKYARAITSGSEQEFTVESDEKIHKARVISSETHLDESTRTLLIRAVTSNVGRTLIPGQSARLKLTISTEAEALTVSSQALVPSSQGYGVYLAKGNRVTLSPVEIGQRGPHDVQIVKGVSAGDSVITSNLLRLTPGASVHFATVE